MQDYFNIMYYAEYFSEAASIISKVFNCKSYGNLSTNMIIAQKSLIVF